MKTKKNKKTQQKFTTFTFGRTDGFTLFELLVSISIIAVLTAVAVVSYGGLNKKTRDSRRVADLEKIRIALEAARQIGNTYPSSLGALVTSGFLDKAPVDPKTKNVYSYIPGSSPRYTYTFCTLVEDIGSTSSDGPTCGTPPSGYAGYYKVVQP